MKKILLILIVLCVPAFVFADFQIGPTALYNFPLLKDEGVEKPELNASNFTFGADARLKLLIFQGSAMALYTPGWVDEMDITYAYPSVDLHLDLGVAFDILMFRFGVGVGPSMQFTIAEEISDKVDLGVNGKASAEIQIGRIALALNYLVMIDFEKGNPESLLNFDTSTGLFGVSALLSLF